MLKKMIATCCLFVTTLCLANSNLTPINKIAAIVNNQVITQMALNKQVAFVKANITENNGKLPPAAVLNKQVLNQLINQDLQLQLAKQNNIQVGDLDINKAIKTIATNNKKTVAEMYASVQSMGLNKTEFRAQIKNELLINKVQRTLVASKITITPDEVKDFLKSNAGQSFDKNEYHLADILITLPNNPTADQIAKAKQQAQAIYEQAKQGKNFRTLAISHSKGQNALQGGDLGWRPLLQLPTMFASRAINMSTGEVAGPLRTANGFYIIKLLGTRAPNNQKALTAAQLHLAVENQIFQRKLQERLQNWILQLRASAYIKTFD